MQCIIEGPNQITMDFDLEKVKSALDTAQRRFLKPLIQESCFDEMCAALLDNVQNGTAIDAKWTTLQDEATPFLVAATAYYFTRQIARARLTPDGLKFDENFKISSAKEYVAELKEDMESEWDVFVEWWEANKTNYDCHTVTETDECCPETYEDFDAFETTSGFNQYDNHAHPNFDKLYDNKRIRRTGGKPHYGDQFSTD